MSTTESIQIELNAWERNALTDLIAKFLHPRAWERVRAARLKLRDAADDLCRDALETLVDEAEHSTAEYEAQLANEEVGSTELRALILQDQGHAAVCESLMRQIDSAGVLVVAGGGES